jgi:hypothetical protein
MKKEDMEFRQELVKVMPGFSWTVEKSYMEGIKKAEGKQTAGMNRLCTLSVLKRTNHDTGKSEYEVKDSGFGLRSPWGRSFNSHSLKSALRLLQNYHESSARHHSGQASYLQAGRIAKKKTEG